MTLNTINRDPMMLRYFQLMATGFLFVVSQTGCSSKPPPKTEDPKSSNLRRVSQAFILCEEFKRRAPQDEEELKRWLCEIGEPGPAESYMSSTRDGEPFVIYYGNSIRREAGDAIVAHEKNGADGVRYVLLQSGFVKQYTDAEFANARFAEKKTPKPRT